MSLMSALAMVPEWLVADLEALIRSVVADPNPRAAAERAARAVVADAADAATDKAVDEALKLL